MGYKAHAPETLIVPCALLALESDLESWLLEGLTKKTREAVRRARKGKTTSVFQWHLALMWSVLSFALEVLIQSHVDSGRLVPFPRAAIGFCYRSHATRKDCEFQEKMTDPRDSGGKMGEGSGGFVHLSNGAGKMREKWRSCPPIPDTGWSSIWFGHERRPEPPG